MTVGEFLGDEYAPKYYGSIKIKEVESLEGSPKRVDGNFEIGSFNLETLEGGPDIVDGSYSFVGSKLESLKGAPKIVGSNFIIDTGSQSLSLDDLPLSVEGWIVLDTEFVESEDLYRIAGAELNGRKHKSSFEEMALLVLESEFAD